MIFSEDLAVIVGGAFLFFLGIIHLLSNIEDFKQEFWEAKYKLAGSIVLIAVGVCSVVFAIVTIIFGFSFELENRETLCVIYKKEYQDERNSTVHDSERYRFYLISPDTGITYEENVTEDVYNKYNVGDEYTFITVSL